MDISKLVAENMKEMDKNFGIQLISLFLEAYIKAEQSRVPYLEKKIDDILQKMASPIFCK